MNNIRKFSMRTNIKALLIVAVTAILTACGGGNDGADITTATLSKVVATVTVMDGNNQSATVGTELANALVALIKNSQGQPIPSQTVNFKVTSGGGSVFAGAATSDASGYVRERWTLGTVSSAQTIEVRAVDSTGAAVVFAQFNAIAHAGAPQSISITSVDGQTAQQLQTLPILSKIVVKDAYGNPVAGIAVAYTASNSGIAYPSAVTTNAAGEASTSWTLGLTVGQQNLAATVTGLTPITFVASATQAPPSAATTLTKISGDSQTVVQHLLLPQPFQVKVTDALGNPVPGSQVNFSAANGSGYISPKTAVTDNTGSANWQGYFHTAGSQNVDAKVVGITSATFTTNVTSSSHTYDGSYICQAVSQTCAPGPFNIINDAIQGSISGSVNNSDGKLTATFSYGVGGIVTASSQITLDALQQAIGTGKITAAFGAICSQNIASTWLCNRQ
jgi:hypothetical protein